MWWVMLKVRDIVGFIGVWSLRAGECFLDKLDEVRPAFIAALTVIGALDHDMSNILVANEFHHGDEVKVLLRAHEHVDAPTAGNA